MLNLSRCKSKIFWLWAGMFVFSTSAFTQTDDSGGLDSDAPSDPAVEEGDPSYELPTDSTDSNEPAEPATESPSEFPDTPEDTTPQAPVSESEPSGSGTFSFLKGSSCTVLPGIASLTPSGDMKELAGTGTQLGLLLKHHMPVTGAFGIHYGLDLRMAKLEKKLSAPNGVVANPSSRWRQSDIFALAIGDYAFSNMLGAFIDFGLGLQYRTFYIKAESTVLPDDYFAQYGFGYITRLGGQIEFSMSSTLRLVSRLYFGFEGGSNLETGKLKYNRKKVDINARQTLMGIDLGVRF